MTGGFEACSSSYDVAVGRLQLEWGRDGVDVAGGNGESAGVVTGKLSV